MKLADIRNERGLSQGQLSEKSGVSVRMIQHYEQGVKDINKASAETIYRLSKALNCRMEDLIMENEFKSFSDMGYKEREFYSKNNENGLVLHLENDFIGIYGNAVDGYVTAYCDSVTAKVIEEDIFYEDGCQVFIEDLEI